MAPICPICSVRSCEMASATRFRSRCSTCRKASCRSTKSNAVEVPLKEVTPAATIAHIFNDVRGAISMSELAKRFRDNPDGLRVALECLYAERRIERVQISGNREAICWVHAPPVQRKSPSPRAKHSDEVVAEARRLLERGLSYKTVSNRLRIPHSTLHQIINGRAA